MPQIDLITGLPGAGKTAFIKKYVKYLTGQGVTAAILESDFGAVNIDMLQLNELIGDKCEVEILDGANGILPYSHRFYTKLSTMAVSGYDRIIVEPFGFYDPDDFFDALSSGPLPQWYSPGSIVNIVDAGMEENLSDEAQYLLVSQTASAGKILLSHCQKTDHPDGKNGDHGAAERILRLLNRSLERFECDRRLSEEDILAKDWDSMTEEDFASIAAAGMIPADYARIPEEMKKGHGTLLYSGIQMEEKELHKKMEKIFRDSACGKVMRVKGFVRTGDHARVQIDATRHEIKIEPTVFVREVLIVSGDELSEEELDKILM